MAECGYPHPAFSFSGGVYFGGAYDNIDYMSIITIPKKITKGDELIVVRRYEYEKLRKHLDEVKDAFIKIRKGESELKKGKARVVKSLSELN